MNKDIDELFDSYIAEEFRGYFRTEGATGVRNLEKICGDLGYGKGEFIGQHYIANFLADNPAAIEMLFEYIRDGVCNPHSEWADALDLQSFDKEDIDEYNEFTVEDDAIIAAN